MIKPITVILFILLLLNANTSFAAFPTTNFNQCTEISTTTSILPPAPSPTASPDTKHHKHHHRYHEEQPEKYDLSVASFVLALCSIIALSFAVGTIATVLGVLGIILAFLAFIIATQALNRKQKLQGLAIFGLIVGSVISLTFIATIIPKLIGSK